MPNGLIAATAKLLFIAGAVAGAVIYTDRDSSQIDANTLRIEQNEQRMQRMEDRLLRELGEIKERQQEMLEYLRPYRAPR